MLGRDLPAVANMALPQVELLLDRQAVRDGELGLLMVRAFGSVMGGGDASRDALHGLLKQAGYESERERETPFKRLLARAQTNRNHQ